MAITTWLPLATAICGVTLISQAADGWSVDGENGVMHVHGVLTENACWLAMNSEWQDVDMGVVETRMLQQVGAHGKAVNVQLWLRDCFREKSHATDTQNQLVVWSAWQPVVTALIVAPADPDDPSLFRVSGTTGLALNLKDSQGHFVTPGVKQKPQLITQTQDILKYQIFPVRTSAPLGAGYFQANFDIQLSYE